MRQVFRQRSQAAFLAVLLAGCASAIAPEVPQERSPDPRPSAPVARQASQLAELCWANPAADLAHAGPDNREPTRWLPQRVAWLRGNLVLGAPLLARALVLDGPGPSSLESIWHLPVRSEAEVLKAAGQAGLRVDRSKSAALTFAASDGTACVLQRSGNAPSGSGWLPFICASSGATLAAAPATAESATPNCGASGLELHIDVAQVEAHWGNQLRVQLLPVFASVLGIDSRNELFDAALGRALDAASVEGRTLISDLGKVTLNVTVLDRTAKVTADLTLTKTDSWVATTLLGAATSQPPAAFWSLPKDATSAVFGHGLAQQSYARPLRLAADLLEGTLAYQGTPPKLRITARQLLKDLPLPTAAYTIAVGSESVAPARSGNDPGTSGWALLALEADADRVTGFLRELVEALADPVLGPQLRRVLLQLAPEYRAVAFTELPRARVRGVSSKSHVYLLSLTEASAKERAQQYTIVVAANGGQTWLSVASDLSHATERLITALSPRDNPRNLAARPELRSLAGDHTWLGGFTTNLDHGLSTSLAAIDIDTAEKRVRFTAEIPLETFFEHALEFSNLLERKR